MRNDCEIRDDIYTLLKGSALEESINGSVQKSIRPKDSDAEDIVISVTGNQNTRVQDVDVYVNIYVPDLLVNGQYEENTMRTRELAALAATLLDRRSPGNLYRVMLDRQSISKVEGKEEHYIKNRLKYTYFNKN